MLILLDIISFKTYFNLGSTDDKKIVSYKWTLESGPTYTLPATNTAILRLENLDPGTYNFRYCEPWRR